MQKIITTITAIMMTIITAIMTTLSTAIILIRNFICDQWERRLQRRYGNSFPRTVYNLGGFMFCGIIFIHSKFQGTADYERILSHERIHQRQFWELLGFGFYIYLWLEKRRVKKVYSNPYEQYLNTALEREARWNESSDQGSDQCSDGNANYLKDRKWWAFRKYRSDNYEIRKELKKVKAKAEAKSKAKTKAKTDTKAKTKTKSNTENNLNLIR